METESEKISKLLLYTHTEHKDKYSDQYMNHYLEQYRIYVNVFNSTSDRRQKTNEFFLGINTAIIGIIGYLTTKDVANVSLIFVFIPIVGMAICFCWYRLILSFSQLNRAKFKVIHALEQRLPANLFDTEWVLLGGGKDSTKYYPISHIERFIPIIFIVLYVVLFLVNFPMLKFFN